MEEQSLVAEDSEPQAEAVEQSVGKAEVERSHERHSTCTRTHARNTQLPRIVRVSLVLRGCRKRARIRRTQRTEAAATPNSLSQIVGVTDSYDLSLTVY